MQIQTSFNQNNRPLVSIIMAAYNAEKTINQSIESVINQTFIDWELIVVDDCSTDATAQIIKKYEQKDSRIKIIQNTENRGVSYSRYRAATEATSNWVAILDSDDIWKLNKLEQQWDLLRNTEADVVYTGAEFIDSKGDKKGFVQRVNTSITYRKLLRQNIIANSSALVRKDLYLKHYAFGDDMHEDYAIWLGILRNGYVAKGIDEPLLVYRVGDDTKSSNKVKSAKMNWNTYKYMGINVFQRWYYMFWYTINGLLKYMRIW